MTEIFNVYFSARLWLWLENFGSLDFSKYFLIEPLSSHRPSSCHHGHTSKISMNLKNRNSKSFPWTSNLGDSIYSPKVCPVASVSYVNYGVVVTDVLISNPSIASVSCNLLICKIIWDPDFISQLRSTISPEKKVFLFGSIYYFLSYSTPLWTSECPCMWHFLDHLTSLIQIQVNWPP